MSLLDDASLLVTPNAEKEGKLYSIIPTNGNGDFSVTRATTATRVNAAGLVELVPYNLLTYSEQFENAAWPKARCTISANVVNAPNGTLTADKLVEDTTATNTHRVGQLFTFLVGNTYTISCYAKAAERTQIGLSFNLVPIATTDGVVFDLSSGTIALQTAGYTGTITSVGDGWYRCTARKTADATSVRADIGICVSNTAIYTGNGTSGVFIWGAQLVEGTSALDYQMTETRLNIPRLDYSLGSCPNILLEPQRTNLALRSEEFDNASWIVNATTISANSTTSPSGLNNADTLTADGTSSNHRISQNISISATTYSYSIYAKKNTNNFIQINTGNSFGGMWANFDINNGVVGTLGTTTGTTPTSSITSVGNGWYRCNITFTSTASGNSGTIVCSIVTSASAARAEVNTLSTSVFLWGAQLEAGAYATSYIPTTSASVTRNADVVQKTGASALIGQTSGTIFIDLNFTNVGTEKYIASIGDNTFTNFISLRRLSTGEIRIIFAASTSSGTTNASSAILPNGRYKIAYKYASGSLKLFINGALSFSLTPTFTFGSALQNIKLGMDSANAIQLGDRINSMALFPTPLTDTQCIALTT